MVTKHAALIYTMVLASVADREMTDSELASMTDIVTRLPVFRDFDTATVSTVAAECAEMLGDEDGVAEVIDIVREALSAPLYETAYALAVEVVASDTFASQEELRFLEMLRHELGIDRLIAAGIERGARARYARG